MMVDVRTPLQLCGFDPVPAETCNLEVPDVQPQSEMLRLLQHQSSMQEVILQQFRQINALKEMMRQVMGEQMRQRCYIHSLECALSDVKVNQRPPNQPVPEVPIPHRPVPKTPNPQPVHEVPKPIPQPAPETHASTPDEATQASSQGGMSSERISLREAQLKDPAIRRVVELKTASPLMTRRQMSQETRVVQKLLGVWRRLEVKGGLLMYKKGGGKATCRYLAVLPRQQREEVFHSLHRSMDKFGYGRILKLVKDRYYWPSLHNEAMAYMRCHRRGVQRNGREASGEISPPPEFRDDRGP
ncbi:uncharacterized protein LOC119738602 [Patiria miniata]|uniref:Integrase zinc-binding domain-containing protein n=1 Tax=Patiria miniata TaxID=46514 RepID=A0A914B1R2_PATMI|nr:uncharacterized protein LOC119738601 [Patiria miniata]XP_038069436.1 uncharacterized protein LOC119738602 [Patiria miniata]